MSIWVLYRTVYGWAGLQVWEQDSQGSIIHKDSIGLTPEGAFHGYYDSSTAAVRVHFKVHASLPNTKLVWRGHRSDFVGRDCAEHLIESTITS